MADAFAALLTCDFVIVIIVSVTDTTLDIVSI